MPKISKRLASLAGKIEDRAYAPLEAIALVKDNANAKFDETMEAHVRLGIDPNLFCRFEIVGACFNDQRHLSTITDSNPREPIW